MNNGIKSKEEEKKSTNLAKFLRILRIQNDELLGDMSDALGIMPSYLSSIEANRRPLTPALKQKLIEVYNLDETQKSELENYIAEAAASVEVNLENVKDKSNYPQYVDTALLFARDISSLNEAELNEIRDMLKKFKSEGKSDEKTGYSKG